MLAKSSDLFLVLEGTTVGFKLESPEMQRFIFDLGLSMRHLVLSCRSLSHLQPFELNAEVEACGAGSTSQSCGDHARHG